MFETVKKSQVLPTDFQKKTHVHVPHDVWHVDVMMSVEHASPIMSEYARMYVHAGPASSA